MVGDMKDEKVFFKALKVSFKVKSKGSFFVSILGLFLSFLPAYVATVLEKFTDEISSIYKSQSSDLRPSIKLFCMFVVINMIMICFRGVQRRYLTIDSVKVRHFMTETVIRTCCKVKYKYLENYDEFNDKLNFIESQAGQRVANSIQNIIIWLQDILTFISITVVLWSVDVWIIMLLIITTLPSVYLSYKQKEEDFKTSTKYMKEGNWVVYRFKQICNKAAIKEIRFFQIYDYLKKQWRETTKKYFKKKNAVVRKYLLYNAVADTLRNGVYIFILLIVAKKIFSNPALGLGTFMLIFSLSSDFQNVTTRVFAGISEFINDRRYMQVFFSLEELEKEEESGERTVYKNPQICFSNVRFQYPNAIAYALKNINVTIKPKEKIAIVGENGSGKTTFINLLCALYDPTEGNITINNEPVKNNISKVRRSISAMFQNYGKYEMSIRRNITISDRDRNESDAVLEELTKKTGAYDFIHALHNGLDELIGTNNQVEQGKELSGGQWQKIAMARTLYRNDSEIMILDEPTSALDPISEANIYREFTDITKDKTVILVSHRLGITALVDRILVFAKGTIVEEGTHNELINKDGLYARMYRAQAQWYIDDEKNQFA